MKTHETLAQRQRHVKVAAHAISEELRLKLIDSQEAFRRLREIHAEAHWPFDEERRDLQSIAKNLEDQ